MASRESHPIEDEVDRIEEAVAPMEDTDREEFEQRSRDVVELDDRLSELERRRKKHEENDKKQQLLDDVEETPLTTAGILEAGPRIEGDFAVAYVTINPAEEPKEFKFPLPEDESQFTPSNDLARFRAAVGESSDSLQGALYTEVPLIWDASKEEYDLHLPKTSKRKHRVKFEATRKLLNTPLLKPRESSDDSPSAPDYWRVHPAITTSAMTGAAYLTGLVTLALIGGVLGMLASTFPFAVDGPLTDGMMYLEGIAFLALLLITGFAAFMCGIATFALTIDGVLELGKGIFGALGRVRRVYKSYMAS